MMTFIDTSALLALLDRNDEHHVDATAAWAVLANQEAELVTTNYVVVETWPSPSIGWGSTPFADGSVRCYPCLTWSSSTKLCTRPPASMPPAGRRQLSLVDCVSFEIIRRMRLRSAFA